MKIQGLIALPALIILIISLLSLRSVAIDFFSNQLFVALLGLTLAFLVSRIDYQLYLFSPWIWYFLSLFLLLITLFFGSPIRGSTRWLDIFGMSLQTSEIVKPLIILFIASYLTEHFPQDITGLLRYIGFVSVLAFLVFIQPDLGSAIVLMALAVSGLVAAGVQFKKLLVVVMAFLLLLPIFFLALKPYQRQRLESFFDMSHDPRGSGYNALQAQIAVGSGKFFGRGLGQGTQSHLRFLPERHTDFIFASVVEELGFVGGLILISAYFVLCYGLIQAAKQAKSEAGSLVCLLIFSLFIIQVGINIGMNMGLLPVTGITLPLLSSGGSSLLSFILLLGLAWSVASRPQSHKHTLELK